METKKYYGNIWFGVVRTGRKMAGGCREILIGIFVMALWENGIYFVIEIKI